MVGLSAWPLPELRRTLAKLATDLDALLAAAAVDALARLPQARPQLMALGRRDLEPAVAERLARRLRAIPVCPLLLLVHGRRGGAIPHELQTLAMELERRRGSPVLVRTLTDPGSAAALPSLPGLQLAPLFLLPGTHVREDLPHLLAQWRRHQSVRAWPFLGAWPRWQQALAQEVAGLVRAGSRPRLLHHPIAGQLGARYLAHLERVTQAVCVAAPLSGHELGALEPDRPRGLLPLALAASRLNEELAAALGEGEAAPLLARQRLRAVLIEELCALP
jgi:sirohydrochlorin ferrochelatase